MSKLAQLNRLEQSCRDEDLNDELEPKMSASKFSAAEVGTLWEAAIYCGVLGRVRDKELSKRLGISVEKTRSIVKTLIEIGFYEPMWRRMDFSKLPEIEWSGPYTAEELIAKLESHLGNSKPS